jgi:hypothetical protein
MDRDVPSPGHGDAGACIRPADRMTVEIDLESNDFTDLNRLERG